MSNTFCPIPFRHLNLKTVGVVNACWRGFRNEPVGDYSKDTLLDIWNNHNYKKLRLDLLNNAKPAHCTGCWRQEEKGEKSIRQRQLEDPFWKNTQSDYTKLMESDGTMPNSSLEFIEIRFDNTCNLMCRHCMPEYSTNWNTALKKDKHFSEQMKKFNMEQIDDIQPLSEKNIDDIIALAPNLKLIRISGGEPLYTQKHFELLEKLQPYAKNIQIEYNSNFHSLNYKHYNTLDLWKNFKKVIVRISIDGEPTMYDYLRVNGKIDNIKNNIKEAQKLDNIGLMGTMTASMFNITRLIRIIEFYTRLGIYFHSSNVVSPKFLDPQVLPSYLKKRLTNNFLEWTNADIEQKIQTLDVNKHLKLEPAIFFIKKFGNHIIEHMNSKDTFDENFDTFLDYANVLDKKLNTNFEDVYPEYKSNYKYIKYSAKKG